MVAIFAGAGTGLERGSGNIIGAAGTLGSASFGRSGSQVQVNAVNGNLVIARRDEFLSVVGDDIAVARTYNSLGDLSDTNGDNWRMGENRTLRGLIGTANGPNSSIERVGADGSVLVYYRDATGYTTTDGANPYDRITWDGTNWRWQDAESRTVETYGSDLRLARTTNRSGHVVQYSYAGDKLSRITGPDGGYLEYSWSGNTITGITSVSQGATATRTRYAYDGASRLSSVTVDLTPDDNSVSDGKVYTTTYTYHGGSRLIATIAETDGSSLRIGYDGANRVVSMAQLVAGNDTRTTTLAYNSGSTVLTDPLGQATTLYYDGAGRLNRITAPPAVSGAAAQSAQFAYNGNGDLTGVTDAAGNGTTYSYDGAGNVLRQTDRLGNVVSRTYSAANQMLTETRTGSDRTSAAGAHTTRYVYDTQNRLRYTVSSEGRVSETRYDGSGLVTNTTDFNGSRYDISGLSATSSLQESQLDNWRNNVADRTQSLVTVFLYDARGNLAQQIAYGGTQPNGAVRYDYGYSHRYFIYDAAGQLLSSGPASMAKTTYVYDGLGRVVSSTDVNVGTTSFYFNDSSTHTTVTFSNGYVQTSTCNKSGELVSRTDSGSFAAGGTASYQYDRAGRLRIMTGAASGKQYHVYDAAGRRVADIAGNGEMTEYRYDVNDRLVATVRYGGAANTGSLGDPNATVAVASLRPAQNAVTDLWSWTVHDKEGRVLQTISGDGSTSSNSYDASGRLVATRTYRNRLTTDQIAAFRGSSPTTAVLPTASGYDIVARIFYDGDGKVIGQLDGEGYLSQTVYDGGGRKVAETGYANAPDASIRAGGTFQALIDSAVAAGTANDRTTRYVYDQQGHLRYTIDAIGRVAEFGYNYDNARWTAFGPVRQTTRYAATLGTLSSYSFESVRSAVANIATDPANRTEWAVYDDSGRLAYAIDATGAVTGYRYDSRGQVIRKVEYATLRSTSSLPTAGDMNSWAGSAGNGSDRTTRFYYTARGELRFTIDAQGYVIRNDYDAESRVVFTGRWNSPVNADDSWSISTVNNALTGDVAITYRSYDAQGRLSSLWNNADGAHRYTYRANGQLAWEIQNEWKSDETRILYGYDEANRLAWKTTAYGTAEQATTSYTYDGLGNLIRITDARNVVTNRSYDRAGQLIAETDAYDKITGYQYNAFGDVVRVTDRRGNSTYRYYDGLGRASVVRDAENQVTETGYTAFGEVAWIKRAYNRATNAAGAAIRPDGYGTHALDATTAFGYDRIGRLVQTRDAEGYVERYTLDAFGNRIAVTNKLGGVTTNGYDRRGLLTWRTRPITSVGTDGQVRAPGVTDRFEYDARGNRTRLIEAQGLPEERITRYLYDRADRLIEVRGPSHIYLNESFQMATTDLVASYRYDTRGNLIESRDANGARTLSYYDDNDRKVAQISPTGTLSTYGYDLVGNMVSSRVYGTIVGLPGEPGGAVPAAPGGEYRETTFAYDLVNRLLRSSIADIRTGRWNGSTFALTTAATTTGYQYDTAGNLTAVTDPEGATTFSYYDRVGRKTAQVDQEGYVTLWVYDAAGNVTRERRYATQTSGAKAGVWPTSVESTADRITDFGYDRISNRISEKRRNVAMTTAGTAGIITATGDATIAYAYNGLGRVTRKTEATGDAINYTFDAAGQLTNEVHAAFVDQDSRVVRPSLGYVYDGLGNLTRTRQGSEAVAANSDRMTYYYYSSVGLLSTKIDATGWQTGYSYDAAGNVLVESRTRAASDGQNVTDAVLYNRDVTGRIVAQGMGTWNGTGWNRGDTQQTVYNAYGEISQRGMNGGWQEQFAYDRAGRLFRSNSGDGVWRYFVHDGAGNQTAAIESEGTDIRGKSLDDMLAYATKNSAYALGGTYIDGINTTLTVFDRRGQATKTILPNRELSETSGVAQYATERSYNAFGEIASERDVRGNYSYMTYNTMGRLTSRQRPDVQVTAENGTTRSFTPIEYFYYDGSGRAVASKDYRGSVTSRLLLAGTGYDGSEALVEREILSDGATVYRTYDQFRDLRGASNGIARWTRMNYDGMGRLTQVTRPSGQSDSYAYDMLGQRIRHWNSTYGEGNAERTDYDMQGRVIRQVSAGNSENLAEATTTTYSWSSSLATNTMETVGGWTATTTYANGKSSSEQTDMFGRTTAQTDLGGHATNFAYDLAGRMTSRSGGVEKVQYGYLNSGLIGSMTRGEDRSATAPQNEQESWRQERTVYGYDAAGNRTSERSTINGGSWADEGGIYYNGYEYEREQHWVYHSYALTRQNATAAYDTLGRMTGWQETGGDQNPAASLNWQYDENGNIRRSQASFRYLDQNGAAGSATSMQDNWYRYDSMNRVTLAKGQMAGGQIVPGANGVEYLYDGAGQRVRATRITGQYVTVWEYDGYTTLYYDAREDETYGYDVDGHLTSVSIATQGYDDNGDGTLTPGAMSPDILKARFGYDAMGRQTTQTDYLYNGNSNGTAAWQRTTTYNARGQVTNESTAQRQGNDTITTNTWNNYGSGASSALGSVVSAGSSTYKGNSQQYSATTTNSYAWYSGAVLASTTYKQSNQSARTTSYGLGASGQLLSAYVADGRPRSIIYTNDMNGQVLRRDETDNSYQKGDPHEVWYRFNGRTLGYVGNNGTQDTSYQQSIYTRTRTQGTGAFDGGSAYASAYADFDQSVAPITSYAQGAGGGSYTVRAGDTLAAIATQLWGDAGLWYKLAEANGLSGASALLAGQSLTIPTGVQKSTHSAATFAPYDPVEAMGDTAPSVQPTAKKNKCGAFGAILLAVIAVAVTAVTYGALASVTAPILTGSISAVAGSVVSQAVGVATGIQDRFDWKGVAMAGLSGAIGGAIGGIDVFGKGAGFATAVGNGVVRGAMGSFVTQAFGVATGLQQRLDWVGVAAAGVSGGVAGGLGQQLGLKSLRGNMTADNIARTALTNTAAGIANAATRSIATNTSFGDNMLAALPDVIGQTVGGLVAGGLARGGRSNVLAGPNASGTDFDVTDIETTGVDLSEGASELMDRAIDRQRDRGATDGSGSGLAGISGSVTDEGEIVVTADPHMYELLRPMTPYRFGMYSKIAGEHSAGRWAHQTAHWAAGLIDPTLSSNVRTSYDGPIGRLFVQQGGAFQGFSYGGRDYASAAAAQAAGMQIIENPRATYSPRDIAFLNSIGSGTLGFGPLAYVNGGSAQTINASGELDRALGDLAIGVAVRPNGRVVLSRPGHPNTTFSTGPVSSVGPQKTAEETAVGGAASLPSGSFSISDWSGYPKGLPKPQGPFRIVEGSEYDSARTAANKANAVIRREQGLVGQPVDVHEIHPVKFGGSPTDSANKVILPRDIHRQKVTPWWNQLQRNIGY
jgi:YD repeat-containing protein